MPKVSVVIPTYCRAELICEAIRSVVVRFFRSFEIIVVDDGTNHKTPELVSAFSGELCVAGEPVQPALPAGCWAGKQPIQRLLSPDVLVKNAVGKRGGYV